MISLLWIASLAIALGGYGLWRGFSRDICLAVMLIALGVAAAALIIISSVASLLVAGAMVIISLGVCVREGQRGKPAPGPRQTRRSSVTPLFPALVHLWQGNIRTRRAPRQGATLRKRSRQLL
ncbi:hypothetical protein [Kushneria indalinina]|uniref:Uncharacterized protein n=1 Tax=Kushneria indalinina DSM 14324 TaxID=1122140 RepID=A0A3D9DYC5_9GAMM|nr:hypothetical protein [Kushneria indalinina]REC95776.1 hypothetical protein C8D72_0441 [Kushneria indalinina DSM 14324]